MCALNLNNNNHYLYIREKDPIHFSSGILPFSPRASFPLYFHHPQFFRSLPVVKGRSFKISRCGLRAAIGGVAYPRATKRWYTTMVDIKEGINIGQSRCLGVAPGRTESEIICSFCNGLIAIYSVSTNLYYCFCNNNSYFS